MSRTLFLTKGGCELLLLRFCVGVVFISEGLQKFIFADSLGAGRFEKIGLPLPELLGPFVGGVELIAGLCTLFGLAIRPACALLVTDMLVALITTKVPILLGHGFAGLNHTFASKVGVWHFLHESRTDLAMLCTSLFLITQGAGLWSLDHKLSSSLTHSKEGT